METLTLIILISFGMTTGFIIFLWVAWLFALHYIIRPQYIRGVLYDKDNRRRLIWLKKETQKGEIGTAKNKVFGTYSYNIADIFQLGQFNALDLSTGSFKALKLKQTKMFLDAERSLHPKILLELLINKFISELVEVKKNLTETLCFIIIALIFVLGIYIYIKNKNISESLSGIQTNITMMQNMVKTYAVTR